MDVNYSVISGTLVREPKIYPMGESHVATATIKASTYYDGREFQNFVPIKVWNEQIKLLKTVSVGGRLTVTGYIKTESYEKDGKKVYNTTLVVSQITPGLDASKTTGRPQNRSNGHAEADLPY